MATDEEYLDSLLKNVMDSEPKPEEPKIAADEIMMDLDEILPEADFVLPETGADEIMPDLNKILPEADSALPEVPAEELPIIESELPPLEELLEEPLIEEPLIEEPLIEEPLLEEPLIEEPLIEEPIIEEPLIEEPLIEEPLIEEPLIEESLIEEPLIDYDELANLGETPSLDEEVDLLSAGMPDSPASAIASEDEPMLSEFDLDAMLAGLDENVELKEDDDLSAKMEDMDIGDLLAGMGDDEDLSGIKDLLDKDDNNELVAGDDMLALLNGTSGYDDSGGEAEDMMALLGDYDLSEEPKKKAKKKKKRGKKSASSDEEFALSPEDIDAQLGTKKKGIISRLFAALTESDDEADEIEATIKTISAENLDILEELDVEDGKAKKTTKKDKKAKKEKKEKKPKEPKPKKPKKEKPPKEPKAKEAPEKRVSKKNILLVFVFSTSLLAIITAFCFLIPDYLEREEIKTAYDNDDYKSIFDLLYAKNRGISDEAVFQQSQVIMRMSRPLESYQIFLSLDKPVEALNALLMGISRYDEIREENYFGAELKVNAFYQDILDILAAEYGISEAEARSILALDPESYTKRLYEIALLIDFS